MMPHLYGHSVAQPAALVAYVDTADAGLPKVALDPAAAGSPGPSAAAA